MEEAAKSQAEFEGGAAAGNGVAHAQANSDDENDDEDDASLLQRCSALTVRLHAKQHACCHGTAPCARLINSLRRLPFTNNKGTSPHNPQPTQPHDPQPTTDRTPHCLHADICCEASIEGSLIQPCRRKAGVQPGTDRPPASRARRTHCRCAAADEARPGARSSHGHWQGGPRRERPPPGIHLRLRRSCSQQASYQWGGRSHHCRGPPACGTEQVLPSRGGK